MGRPRQPAVRGGRGPDAEAERGAHPRARLRRQLRRHADDRREVPGQARVSVHPRPRSRRGGRRDRSRGRPSRGRDSGSLAVLRFGGGYAEEIAVNADAVVPIPDAMDFVTAAAFPVAYGTSHFALTHRGHLKPGETLLVLGAAGGVGLTAVEIGKQLGARVIAAAGSPEKLAVAREHGADELIDYQRESIRDRVRELTGGLGRRCRLRPGRRRCVRPGAARGQLGGADAGDRLRRGPHPVGPGQSDPGQEHLGDRRRLGRAGGARPGAGQPQPRRIAALVGGRAARSRSSRAPFRWPKPARRWRRCCRAAMPAGSSSKRNDATSSLSEGRQRTGAAWKRPFQRPPRPRQYWIADPIVAAV